MHTDMAKRLSKSSATSLLDLPQSTLLYIAELLPCKDLPSLMCTCKELAGMAPSFYGERHVLDMRCFDKVSPALCAQLVHRFASSSLAKCYFRCDLSYQHHSPSSSTFLRAVIERFLDNYRCDEDLLNDLHTAVAADNVDWFPGVFVTPPPRPIDVLAHCFLLESLLSTQPAMSELILDVELGVFRVPKSKGYRQHWHLMHPFLAVQSIQRKCPSLERYACTKMLYQNSMVDMKHVQLRFIENSRQLKSVSTVFELDMASLESYELLKGPLLLEKAAFRLPKWFTRQGNSRLSREKWRTFAQKMPRLKTAAMIFSARGTLRHAQEFLCNLQNTTVLSLICEFNAGYPNFDIDEGMQMGGFFEGFEYLLPAKLQKLSMFNVPEAEFGLIFGSESAKLLASLEHISVRFAWSNAEIKQEHLERIEIFFRSSPFLQSLCIECYFSQNRPIFSKTLSRRAVSM